MHGHERHVQLLIGGGWVTHVSCRLHVRAGAVRGALIAISAFASIARAETQSPPAPIVASNFVFVPDAGGTANLGCPLEQVDGAALPQTIAGLLESVGLDPRIVVVLATQPLICSDIYYLPLANDVQGIGYQHQPEGELFDETPASRLEGIAFLNDFPYWQEHPAEFQDDFNHEIGHRWGARIHASIDGADSTELLGRDLLHWSYFLNSGGSPLEGNIWSEDDDGRYRADTPFGPGQFSDLDLYAMGVLSPSEIGQQELLRPLADSGATDCLGFTLTADSPPQSCGAYETGATPVSFGIEDVIAVEGARNPPAVDATVTVDIAVVVLESGTKPFDLQSCQAMTDAVTARIADFATASAGRVSLVNLVTSGADCASFTKPAAAAPVGSGGCAIAPLGSSRQVLTVLFLAILITAGGRACGVRRASAKARAGRPGDGQEPHGTIPGASPHQFDGFEAGGSLSRQSNESLSPDFLRRGYSRGRPW